MIAPPTKVKLEIFATVSKDQLLGVTERPMSFRRNGQMPPVHAASNFESYHGMILVYLLLKGLLVIVN